MLSDNTVTLMSAWCSGGRFKELTCLEIYYNDKKSENADVLSAKLLQIKRCTVAPFKVLYHILSY